MGRSRGVRGKRTDHTKRFRRTLAGFGHLVLHGVRKSTFQHLTVNCHFNVVEMALKTFHFVQGLSRTPLLFIPRYYTNIIFKNDLPNKKDSIIENLEIWKSKNPGSLTGAQATEAMLAYTPKLEIESLYHSPLSV